MRVVVIGAGYVNEVTRLARDHFDNFRVCVPERGYCNASVEVKKRISVDVFQDRSVAALYYKWVAARVARRNVLSITVQYLFGFRSRESGFHLRQSCLGNRLHKTSTTFEENETFIAGNVPAHRAWLMEGWSVREKVSADRAGGAYGCISHLGHLPFRMLKS